MRSNILILFYLLPFLGLSQVNFTAEVKDKINYAPIDGAFVRVLKNGKFFQSITTTPNGSLMISNMTKGQYIFQISHLGYENFQDTLFLLGEDSNDPFLKGNVIFLAPKENYLGAAIITAVRAKRTTPIVFTNLENKELLDLDQSKDFTFILNTTPSTVVSSDAGNGVGYTGVTIRGIDPTRVNVTINGIPLNDAESQGVYWVNMPDLVGNTESVQIQRGVGTSSNGPGAFGASVNIRTADISDSQFLSLTTAYGSFNTSRLSLGYGTGRNAKNWAFQMRGSVIQSDGFIDRAASDLKSFNASLDKIWIRSSLKFNVLLGSERTFQAWNGIPEPKFRGDFSELNRYVNDLGISGSDLENLLQSNPNTYNAYTYPNEVDNYNQNHYQVFFDHQFDDKWKLNSALYTTTGKGYFEQFRKNERFNRYDLESVVVENDTFNRGDLVRRRWLDNQLYGGLLNLSYVDKNIEINVGGGYSIYFNRHFGEVIATQFTNYEAINHLYYDNDAQKTDGNVFLKALYKWGNWIPYVDLQWRTITYDFEGFDNDFIPRPYSTSFNFFNPRVGLSYIQGNHQFYGFAALAHREPVRKDFRDNTLENWPESEELQNLELGYKFQGKRSYFNVNLYHMNYINQLVLTGGVNDVGDAIRFNVPESWRSGIELDGQVKVNSKFSVGGNMTLSENKIKEFSVTNIDFLDGEAVTTKYENTQIAMSPNFIASLVAIYQPIEKVSLSIFGKRVGAQYLDNTQNDLKKLDGFTNVDISCTLDNPFKMGEDVNLGLYFNNVLNAMYAPNGYTFGWLYGRQEQLYNYVFPMAGFNWMVKLQMKF